MFDGGYRHYYGLELTAEEEAFVDSYRNGYGGDVKKLPVELLNQVLLDYTGYTLDQTEFIGLEHWRYYEPTDCYFGGTNGSAGADEIETVCGSREENGTVHLISKAEGYYLQLKLLPREGSPDIPYFVYSCYEIEPRT